MSSTTAMRRYQPYVCLKQSFRMQNWKRSGDQMISNVITPRSFLIVRRGALHIVARPQRVVYGHNRAQFTPTDVYIIRYSTNIHVCVHFYKIMSVFANVFWRCVSISNIPAFVFTCIYAISFDMHRPSTCIDFFR